MAARGLSNLEIRLASELEFRKKYYFTRNDIARLFENKKQLSNTIFGLRKKERVIKLNRSKYYFVPVKARTGKWVDEIAVAVDEILDGKDYFIGGWFAANYWRFTNQTPMQVDVYTTRRQGKMNLFNTRIVFHRTSRKSLAKAARQETNQHYFFVINRKEAGKWMKSKE